jgi:hypothetical protein
MIKKTKDAFKQIAEKIEHAYEYNKTNQQSPIKLVSIEISRGLYNLGDEEIYKRVKEEIDGDFKLHTNDHDDYIMLFVKIK